MQIVISKTWELPQKLFVKIVERDFDMKALYT